MPCNAVSVVKAAVSKAYLQALLTITVLEKAIPVYLQQEYPQLTISLATTSTQITVELGSFTTISIVEGQVTVTNQMGNTSFTEQVAVKMEVFLQNLADALYTEQIRQTLAFWITDSQQVTVDNDGSLQQATIFTLEIE